MTKFLTRSRRSRLALPTLLVAAALGLAGCGGSDGSTASQGELPAAAEPSQGATLIDVTSVDDLRTRFNTDIGQPRLVLLLSPT